MRKYIYIIWVVFVSIFLSCTTEKEEIFEFAFVKTNVIINQTNNTVTFKGELSLDGADKPDSIGFTWGEHVDLKFNPHRTVYKKYTDPKFRIEAEVDMPQGVEVFYKAIAKQGKWTHSGEVKSFKNIGLEMKISRLYPNPIIIGDTLTIFGSNFGKSIHGISLNIGGVFFHANKVYADSIKVVINKTLELGKKLDISINRSGNVVNSDEKLIISKMEITDFYPKIINAGDSITIETKNINLNSAELFLSTARISFKFKDGKLRARIPYSMSGDLKFSIRNYFNKVIADNNVKINPSIITDKSIHTFIGDTITLNGQNLPTDIKLYKVEWLLGNGNYGGDLEIVSVAKDEIKIFINKTISQRNTILQIKYEGVTFKTNMQLRMSLISKLNKTEFAPGDTIVIYGRYLYTNDSFYVLRDDDDTNDFTEYKDPQWVFNTQDSVAFVLNPISYKRAKLIFCSNGLYAIYPKVLTLKSK